MKKYFKFLVAITAVLFSVSASAQLFPGKNRGDDRYENRRYEDNRYGNDRYGNDRYGNNWYNIDRVRVSNRSSYERVNLNSREARNMRQLLFRTDGSVNIYRVAVRYNNGRTEELRVRNNRWDSRNRSNRNDDLMVTIPGRNYSDIRQVTFWYETDNRSPFASRPVVSILGR